MTAPATPAAGAESPVVPAAGAAAAAAAAPAAPAAPALSPIKEAAAAARALIAERDAAAAAAPATPAAPAAPAAAAAETPEEIEARELLLAGETPEERTARETAEAAAAVAAGGDDAAAALRVALPATAEGEEDFDVEFGDPESAARARALAAGYMRGTQARAVYDDAQQLRDQAELMTYEVEGDPTGFVTHVIKAPADLDHLFKYLATRPGVLDRTKEYLARLVDEPETLEGAAAVMEAERIRRRDALKDVLASKRAINENARQLVSTLHKTIDTTAPEGWTTEAKRAFSEDVLTDLRAFAAQKKLQTVDPRAIPGLVLRRFKLYGVTPRKAGAPAAPSRPGAKPVVPVAAEVTAQALVDARNKRTAASSAPPGAGSPVATIGKPPAYDPKQPGTPIQQAARFARAAVAAMRKRPA